MAMTKPKRTPPPKVPDIPSDLESATISELIQHLETRVGALVVAWTKIPKLTLDRKTQKTKSVVKGKSIEHDGYYRIGGPACLIESLLEMIESACEDGPDQD